MMRVPFLSLALLSACGGADSARLAYTLFDADARAAGLAPATASGQLPFTVDPALDPAPGMPSLLAGELAWVRGESAQVLRLGVDAADDRMSIVASEGAARALAELLDAELSADDGAYTLSKPDLWALAADLEPPESIEQLRPIIVDGPMYYAPTGVGTPDAERAALVGLYRVNGNRLVLDAAGRATVYTGRCLEGMLRGSFVVRDAPERAVVVTLDSGHPITIPLVDGELQLKEVF